MHTESVPTTWGTTNIGTLLWMLLQPSQPPWSSSPKAMNPPPFFKILLFFEERRPFLHLFLCSGALTPQLMEANTCPLKPTWSPKSSHCRSRRCQDSWALIRTCALSLSDSVAALSVPGAHLASRTPQNWRSTCTCTKFKSQGVLPFPRPPCPSQSLSL